MSDVKRCKQCGMLKDADEYRQYTYSKKNETPGRLSICRQCEAINSKYKKLKNLLLDLQPDDALPSVQADIETIEKLFVVLESQGLHTPLSREIAPPPTQITDTDRAINRLMEFYDVTAPTKTAIVLPTESKVDIPAELQHWLETPMDDWMQQNMSPEFLQETIYESLKAKYRPQIGMDKERFVPIYDDTFKDVLNNILRRFDDYEEACAFSDSDG